MTKSKFFFYIIIVLILFPSNCYAHSITPFIIIFGGAYILPFIFSLYLVGQGKKIVWSFVYLFGLMLGITIIEISASMKGFIVAIIIPIFFLLISIVVKYRNQEINKSQIV